MLNLCIFSYFFYSICLCSTRELWVKSAGKILHWLCSKYNWRHNNDVIIVKISQNVANEIPTKCIFQIFRIFKKIDRITSICYLLMIRPSYIYVSCCLWVLFILGWQFPSLWWYFNFFAAFLHMLYSYCVIVSFCRI